MYLEKVFLPGERVVMAPTEDDVTLGRFQGRDYAGTVVSFQLASDPNYSVVELKLDETQATVKQFRKQIFWMDQDRELEQFLKREKRMKNPNRRIFEVGDRVFIHPTREEKNQFALSDKVFYSAYVVEVFPIKDLEDTRDEEAVVQLESREVKLRHKYRSLQPWRDL